MLTFEVIIVFLGLIGMVTALLLDKMRPGMILFSVTVFFLCFGILTPKEMLEGFSNKGMITVALLFLISEGVRQSGALGQLIKKLLPQEKTTVMKAQARMLPVISFVSAFLNNTPVVVIFAPIVKRWAESVGVGRGKDYRGRYFSSLCTGDADPFPAGHVCRTRTLCRFADYGFGLSGTQGEIASSCRTLHGIAAE